MLTWNVYIGDFNGRKIEVYNIFDHGSFYNDCLKNKRKNGKDRDVFFEEMRKDLMYYFWSKCEWEIILQHWPSRPDFRDLKIDVYDQVRLNWDAFTDYVWTHIGELKKIRE